MGILILSIKKNEGSLAARKTGIKKATGEYCIFVDSDDYILPNLVKDLMEKANNQNIDAISYNMFVQINGEYRAWYNTVEDGLYQDAEMQNLYKKMIYNFESSRPGIMQSLCTKMIKREILCALIAEVNENLTWGDDASVTYLALLKSHNVLILSKPYYYYRENKNSLCHTSDKKIFGRLLDFQQHMVQKMEEYPREWELESQIKAYTQIMLAENIKKEFEYEIESIYEPPYEMLRENARIVIYGKGVVGKSYYQILSDYRNVEIVAWIDKNNFTADEKRAVHNLVDIRTLQYDLLLIAVQRKDLANTIISEISEMVPQEKIVWAWPKLSGRNICLPRK